MRRFTRPTGVPAANAEHVDATIFGPDFAGAAQAYAIEAKAQAANAGHTNGHVTVNPTTAWNGDTGVQVQRFLGAGQLAANLGGSAPNNNPTVDFHATDSSPLLDDPVMGALIDQTSRGVMV